MSDCHAPECDRPATIKKYSLCHFHNKQRRDGVPFHPPARRDGGACLVRDERGRKHCIGCDRWQPESAFASMKGRPDNLQTRCRECKSRNYYANKEKVRDSMREQRFGLTRAEFDAMLEAQGGACAICKSDTPGPNTHWHVDHDHDCCPSSNKTCGKCVRGLLCRWCNHMLGSGRDNPDILRAGIDYLGRTSMRAAS